MYARACDARSSSLDCLYPILSSPLFAPVLQNTSNTCLFEQWPCPSVPHDTPPDRARSLYNIISLCFVVPSPPCLRAALC